MRIHHLNCGTMCPWGGRLMDGRARLGERARIVCHCLAIETSRGLVLVDTGLGMRDTIRGHQRLSSFFVGLNRPRLSPRETAFQQLAKLGFGSRDVRHIVLTHLDFDHAGGIEDFPEATVHVLAAEREAADLRKGFIARRRYRPMQWDEGVRWRTYKPHGETWEGFECVRAMQGLPEEILLVPLRGHTFGHCGVAVRAGDGWLFHAGDSYFYRDEMAEQPRCTPGLAFYQRMMEVDREARLANQVRVRHLARTRSPDIRVFSAHDAVEFARLAGETVEEARGVRRPPAASAA